MPLIILIFLTTTRKHSQHCCQRERTFQNHIKHSSIKSQIPPKNIGNKKCNSFNVIADYITVNNRDEAGEGGSKTASRYRNATFEIEQTLRGPLHLNGSNNFDNFVYRIVVWSTYNLSPHFSIEKYSLLQRTLNVVFGLVKQITHYYIQFNMFWAKDLTLKQNPVRW